MKTELEVAFAKLTNPRMSAGLMVLYTLLEPLKGTTLSASEVRAKVDKVFEGRRVSKQSITNAARRLEEANMLDRSEGYAVNYGYITSVLLNTVIELSQKVDRLEEEIEELKESQSLA